MMVRAQYPKELKCGLTFTTLGCLMIFHSRMMNEVVRLSLSLWGDVMN
jgi:hypothetical protein